MWNDLGPELRGAESLSIFKKNFLKLYRPAKKAYLIFMTLNVLNGFFNLEWV